MVLLVGTPSTRSRRTNAMHLKRPYKNIRSAVIAKAADDVNADALLRKIARDVRRAAAGPDGHVLER
jgi:hypothetical protein